MKNTLQIVGNLERFSIQMFRGGFCILLGILSFAFSASAQTRTLEIQGGPTEISFLKKVHSPSSFSDSLSVISHLSKVLEVAHQKGFLLAELSRLRWQENRAVVYLDLKTQYRFFKISNGNIPANILKVAKLSQLGHKSSYSAGQLPELMDNLLTAFCNSGYPFASVYLDSVSILGNTIEGKLFATSGGGFTLDSLQVIGDAKISRSFLQSYLDLRYGSVYKEKRVSGIERRLNELPFIRMERKPATAFTANRAQIQLFLDKQSSNQFEGIIAFVPESRSGAIQLTGDIKLLLQNAFKRSEVFDISFKGLPGKGRELKLGTGFSELFATPLGLIFNFNLYKQDTSFQSVISKIGLTHRLYKGNFSVFLQNQQGTTINQSSDLKRNANTKYLSYGAGWSYRTLNSILQPRKGIALQFEAEAGTKKVSENSGRSSPEAVSLTSNQYKIRSSLQFFQPVSKKAVIKLNNETGLLIGKNLYENELYRIGGFNSLRGFDEQSIFASTYSIFNAEYRLLVERESFLFAFFNQAFIRHSVSESAYSDEPRGFGCGLNLKTQAGLFSFSYALGKQKDNPVNLQEGKIHFGLVTLF